MPTTVSSGIVLTQQAQGNDALALLLTVVTNSLAVFTVPPMLDWLVEFKGVWHAEIPLSLSFLSPFSFSSVFLVLRLILARPAAYGIY